MLGRRTRGFLQAAVGTFAVTPDAVLLRLAETHGNAPLWTATALKLMFIGFFCTLNRLTATLDWTMQDAAIRQRALT